jgi:hypothetical protein
MLLIVSVVLDINETLGVAVAKVRWMRRTIVDHGLVNWIRRFVWKDTSRQTGNHFLHLMLETGVQNIVVYLKIDALKTIVYH